MPVTPDRGLSPRARDLWRASLRYRLLADALAARAADRPAAAATELVQ